MQQCLSISYGDRQINDPKAASSQTQPDNFLSIDEATLPPPLANTPKEFDVTQKMAIAKPLNLKFKMSVTTMSRPPPTRRQT